MILSIITFCFGISLTILFSYFSNLSWCSSTNLPFELLRSNSRLLSYFKFHYSSISTKKSTFFSPSCKTFFIFLLISSLSYIPINLLFSENIKIKMDWHELLHLPSLPFPTQIQSVWWPWLERLSILHSSLSFCVQMIAALSSILWINVLDAA